MGISVTLAAFAVATTALASADGTLTDVPWMAAESSCAIVSDGQTDACPPPKCYGLFFCSKGGNGPVGPFYQDPDAWLKQVFNRDDILRSYRQEAIE